jgi:hypothetical protein
MGSDTFGMGAVAQWAPISLQQKQRAYSKNLEQLKADVDAAPQAPAVGQGATGKDVLLQWTPISLQQKLLAYSTNRETGS